MRIIPEPALKERTTIRLGGTAIAEVLLEKLDDLYSLDEVLNSLGGSPLFMGRGSNILARDGSLPLVLVRPKFGARIAIRERRGQAAVVRADADTPLPRLLRFCLAQGLGGLEGLCGIPGQVGGGVAMNAGSFGTEICARLQGALVFSRGQISYVNKDEITYSYRQMELRGRPEKTMLLKADFALTASPKNVIFNEMLHNFVKKKSRQPLDAWSAGCAFRNPDCAETAGKLLDMAGLRGKRLGGMAFSQKHANFLVNEGRGSASAGLELLAKAKEIVSKRFAINLTEEIKIVP